MPAGLGAFSGVRPARPHDRGVGTLAKPARKTRELTARPGDAALSEVVRSPAWQRTYRDHAKRMPKKRRMFGE
jgi:hypothetical protein